MFVKITTSGPRQYVKLVESYRDASGVSRQKVIATLGRLEDIQAGETDALVNGLLRVTGRPTLDEGHHPDWRQRHTEPEALGEDATRMQVMIHRLKTQAGGSQCLPDAQTNRGAGLRHHQVGDGLPAVLTARLDTGTGGMEPRLYGVEFKTYGRTAPVEQENAEKR